MMSVMVPEVVTLSDDEEETPRKRARLNDSLPTASAEISMGAPINIEGLLGRLSANFSERPVENLLKQINTPISTVRHSLPNCSQQNAEWNRVQPNAQIPTHIVRKVAQREPEERLTTYTFAAHGQIDDNSEEVNAKFKCTYQSCNKIVRGNVDFISHLWAHIVDVTPAEVGDRRQRQQRKNFSDVRSITTCQQCLSAFESPHKLQIHYTRCHSRINEATNKVACQICEKEVTVLLEHLTRHPPRVAPYACQVRSCQYRTTQRMILFNHYIQHHANSMYLWCPFCTYVDVISRSQLRTKDVITCKNFVNHMAEHGTVLTTYRCSNCAYVFLSRGDMERHRASDHNTSVPHNWIIKQLPANSFRQRKVGSIHSTHRKGTVNCDACIVNGSSVVTRCTKCKITAYEESISELEKLSKENPARRIVTNGRYLSECECGFATRDGNLMASHRLEVCDSLGLTETKMDHSIHGSIQEDIIEAKIFAVIHPEPSVPQMTTVGNDLEALNKIRDEFADVDDLEFLVYKQFLVRAQVNDICRSFRRFDKCFKSK
ncbi:unnamed protein product, partial [Mesorhabditis belari]|uniref:C2H2-type domain-containing protein n=1 Tax=Mesorhabditis belari TaxID=2138241 RepID=A0AAF3F643_9BILA